MVTLPSGLIEETIVLNLRNQLSQTELSVFRTVYEAGPISRVKAAKRLRLTRATVSVITKKLKELDLIMETGKVKSAERRGRREVMLMVNPQAGYLITVHIELFRYNVGLVDLTGNVIEKESSDFPLNSPPLTVLDPLIITLQRIIDKHHVKKQKIFGIVIVIPGVINYKNGYPREITLKGWQGFELKKYLEDKFDIQVLIENDVKTHTLGEYQFGIGKNINDLICLWLGNGIGAGIITNGRLIRGISSSAGEIGFNEFILEPPTKKSILISGDVRCWGDALSITNIKATIRRGIGEGWKTHLTEHATISDFTRAVESGDPLGMYIFQLLSQVIGLVSLNLIFTFNPEILLHCGPLVNELPRLATDVRTHIKRSTLQSPIENLEIKTSILGDNGILIGGVALMLDYLFQNSDNYKM